jgi:signal transduction histidine kinase
LERIDLLRARIGMGLDIIVVTLVVFAAADLWQAPPALTTLLAIKIGGLAAADAAARVSRRLSTRRALVLLALAIAATVIAGSAISGVLIGDPVTTPIMSAVVCIICAAVLPWGVRPQMSVVAVATAVILVSSYLSPGSTIYPALAALIGCVASIPIGRELGRRRHRSSRAQREEAETSAMLAKVGDQLTLEADKPDTLLPRTCRLVAEALGADVSHTFVFEDDWLVAAAAYGETAAESEVYTESRLPRSSVDGLVERLRGEGAVRLTMADALEFRAAPPPLKHGITMAIYFPLRRGSEMIGIQSAEYRGRTEPLPASRERLARGVSHLASLALESARLVQALGAANRVKTDFLANMSHELRTPLNVIIGYNDLLLEGAFDPLTPEQAGTLERVQRSARELLELVTTTLELSRSDGRSVQLQLHDMHVDALIEDLVQEMRAVPRKPGVRLLWSAPKGLPAVHTDRRHMKIILKNLLDNAVKFTDRGRVTIEAAEEGGGVMVRVTDTGIGIRPEDVERVFEPFHRGDNPAVQRQSGVGLGLYIVRRLVDGLAGRIDVQSVVGRGSTFTVWVPVSAPSPVEQTGDGRLAEVG